MGSGVAATNGGAFVLVGGKAALAIVSAFVVGAIAGGVGVLGVTGNRAPDSAPPSASTPSTAVAFSAVPTPIASTMTALPPAVSSSNAPTITVTDLPEAAFTKPAQSAPPISGSGLAAERALLDVARAALGRGSPEEALEAAMRHAREYPSGVLTEEREALAIRALAASGNRDAAVARASRFRSRYPKSLLLPAVEGATR